MIFDLTPPGALEVEEVKNEEKHLSIQPVLIKGNHMIRVAYCKAKGAGGTESKAVLLFNANTGEFSVQKVDSDAAKFDFDKPADEFQRRRQQAKTQHQKRVNARKSSDEPKS